MRTKQVQHTPCSRSCVLSAYKRGSEGRTALLTTGEVIRHVGDTWNPEEEVERDLLKHFFDMTGEGLFHTSQPHSLSKG